MKYDLLLFVHRAEVERVKDEAALERLHKVFPYRVVVCDRRNIRIEVCGDRDQYLLIRRKI